MKTVRVFPRRTNATPDDDLAVVGRGPHLWDEADEVLISVAFTWDLPAAERLEREWKAVAPVSVGGPAVNSFAGEFEPGVFLRRGYTITSRGCPHNCARCLVPRREGKLRLLTVKEGWDVLDNNFLATPRGHQELVFSMLRNQSHPVKFSGGWEAERVTPWHCEQLLSLSLDSVWMAYDEPSDYEPLRRAVGLMAEAGLVAPHKRKRAGCFVLMGWREDTPDLAEARLRQVIELGIRTQAMLLNNGAECRPEDMARWWYLRKHYTNAAEVGAMVAETWENS